MQHSSFWDGGPKTMFFTGLFLGIAASAIVMLGVFFSLVWNGQAAGTKTGTTVGTNNPTPTQPAAPTYAPGGPVDPFDEKNDHWIGSKNAKVTLIEYSDFECPFCERHLPSLKQALADFPNDVRLVYRHYPLSFHPSAQKAAEASECAAKLGGNEKFWEMHDKVFAANPSGLSVAVFKRIAGEIGLNQSQFDSCLDSGETANAVQEDFLSGTDAGVEGTPATFVNGQLVSGAVPYATLKAAIEAAGATK